ncbi:MAG: DUF3050 domain-containing protein [Planctomycetota bacterium]
MNQLQRITESVAPLQEKLIAHPIYGSMKSLADVQVFMENHVFAVWDFMAILKSLQASLTCTDTVWLPAKNTQTCRLINEIVLCEETDESENGEYASHFELYHRSMVGCGADTTQIDRFLDLLRHGTGVFDALQRLEIPECTRSFVYRTMSTALQGQVCEVAAAFAFGREDLLPSVFERVVVETQAVGDQSFDDFLYYLNRHIEIDGDSHGPMAEQMVVSICGEDDLKWRLAEESAIRALQARIMFWDGVLDQIREPSRTHRELGDYLESTIQLGWLNGLSVDEIGEQLQMPRNQIEAIISQGRDRRARDQKFSQLDA